MCDTGSPIVATVLNQPAHRYILIRDLSIFGQATYLKVPRRQFYCGDCQNYFTES
jgi:transposase